LSIKKIKIWNIIIGLIKKEKIDETINMVTSFVQDGKWDLEKYKEKIKEEKDWDKKLIELLSNDTSLEETQKKITKGRY